MPLFEPGNQMNPHGRPKGSVGGRARALMLLDSLMAEDANLEKLRDAMQETFDANPMRFFRNVIMPLLPRDMVLKLGEEGVIKWTSLLDTFPMPHSNESITIDVTDSVPSVAADDGARRDLLPQNSST